MAKAKIPPPPSPGDNAAPKRAARRAPTAESSLLVARLKEWDREFARQTKQLTALTKKLSKKITGSTQNDKSPK